MVYDIVLLDIINYKTPSEIFRRKGTAGFNCICKTRQRYATLQATTIVSHWRNIYLRYGTSLLVLKYIYELYGDVNIDTCNLR